MDKVTIEVLLFSLISFNSAVQGSDLEILPDDILQDIYDIYNNLPVVVRDTTSQQVTAENIKYYVYNSSSPDIYSLIDSSNASSVLSSTVPIVFLIHGWMEDYQVAWYDSLKQAFFQRNSQYLVIKVDWSVYSKLNYYIAQFDTEEVGFLIGEFIATLVTPIGIPLENILIVGHSLGGQVSGFAGKKVFQLLGQVLPRIIALDPAGPLFEGRPPAERLYSTDASVVHVIHTNGGVFGYLEGCGTIDFFPNGGTLQPGCLTELITNITDIPNGVLCNHFRSWKFLIEAVGTDAPTFVSTKCDTYAQFEILPILCDGAEEEMGSLETTNTGDYFLDTNSQSPYSQ